MPELIGGTYEVLHQLGAGGGGIVYLARHQRLNKQVVLKADKRKITTRPELLRREVDVLKNLSHPYIPQVYDFFIEEETVYTAMDFVDGESLDKPLKRGERFPQAQVIRWARQLLEALEYLHSPTHGDPPRGYVHSDIKPANMMLRENGDICLIDFNISLALGEENVIGATAGYASPEHYGLDFSFSSGTATGESKSPLSDKKEESAATHKTVVPDVRSDIYSTGATLYHLLSGKRPARHAKEVTPLSDPAISPQVAAIIGRAMAPNPDLRYQTAAEMLEAFDRLWIDDPRAKRLKRQRQTAAGVLAALFLVGGVCTFTGLRGMQRAEQAARAEAERLAVEEQQKKEEAQRAAAAEQEANEALELVNAARSALAAGDAAGARARAAEALGKTSPYAAEAQRVLAQAIGVYDLTDGYETHCAVTLPSEVIKQAISPDGAYAAVLTSGQVHLVALETGEIMGQLFANSSAYSDMAFANEHVLIYAGPQGVCAYDADARQALWEKTDGVTTLAVSRDGSAAAAALPDGSGALLYDCASGVQTGAVDFAGKRRKMVENNFFADPMNDLFALDDTGRYLAVSFEDGGVTSFDTANPGTIRKIWESSQHQAFEGGFLGTELGFAAFNGAESDVYVMDVETGELKINAHDERGRVYLAAAEDGFCVAQPNLVVRVNTETGEQTELAYTASGIEGFSHADGATLVRTKDGKLQFFDANGTPFDEYSDVLCDFAAMAGSYTIVSGRDSPSLRVLKWKDHAQQQMAVYPREYVHEEARVSAGKDSVMLYSVQGGRIYSLTGEMLAELAFPEEARIFDQQYRRENGQEYLEVICKDGTRLCYSASDGALISEEAGEKPEDSFEETETEHYRVRFPFHGTPVVYDRVSGEQIRELQSEDYLTYFTEMPDGVVTEYMTSQGVHYGLLLNENWEVMAELPNLCDILPDGTLVFDDMRGNLRESRIYSARELIALGNTQ